MYGEQANASIPKNLNRIDNMFFRNKKNKIEEADDTAPKKQSLAGFLFNPRLGDDIRPIGENISMFVRFIALAFAANGLFPRNHPALLGETGHRLTMGMVISTAYRNVSFTREGLPKAILFFAIVGCLAFSALAVITLFLLLLTGTAHAESTTSTNGLFGLTQEQKDADLAYQWFKYLFTGEELSPEYTKGTGALAASGAIGLIQSALKAALGTYSSAVLVLGGIILMYHLLSMVAETAHTGKPMGRANQVWAPIRLVVAIGLLVPVTSSGLNVGQHATIQVARWGSALATNTWGIFIDKFQDQLDIEELRSPPAPLIDKVAEDVLIMAACTHAYNHLLGWSILDPIMTFLNGVMDFLPGMSYIREKILGSERAYSRTVVFKGPVPRYDLEIPFTGLGIGEISESWYYSNIMGAVCGKYTWTLQQRNNSSDGIFPTRSDSPFFDALIQKNKETINGVANGLMDEYSSGGASKDCLTSNCEDIAGKIVPLMDRHDGGYNSSSTDPVMSSDFTNLKIELRKKIQENVAEAFEESKDERKEEIQEKLDIMKDGGWVMAGAWLNTIARTQGNAVDQIYNSMPKTTSPLAKDDSAFTAGRSSPTREKVMKELMNYKGIIKDEKIADDVPKEQAAKVAISGATTDKTDNIGTHIAFAFLWAIDKLGASFGAWPATDSNICQNDPEACILWPLQSSNPLGELAMIGYSNLNLGLSLVVYGIATELQAAMVKAVGTATSTVTAGIGEAIGDFIGTGLEMLAQLFFIFGMIFTLTGVMLAYVLPLIPFVRFFFNTMNWTIMLFEAVVSMPIFALAHLDPTGDGLPGSMARPGYFFLLAIMLRPVLMIFGLVAGLLLFNVAISLLNFSFTIASAGTGALAGGGGWATLGKFIYSIMYLVLAYICANTCFKAIGHFPDHALRWMNASGPGTKDLGDQGTFDKVMAGTAVFLQSKVSEPFRGGHGDRGKQAGAAIGKALGGNSGSATGATTGGTPGAAGGGGGGGGAAAGGIPPVV